MREYNPKRQSLTKNSEDKCPTVGLFSNFFGHRTFKEEIFGNQIARSRTGCLHNRIIFVDLVMETTQHTSLIENNRKDKIHVALNSSEHTISETILLAQLHALLKDSKFISGAPIPTSRKHSRTSRMRVRANNQVDNVSNQL